MAFERGPWGSAERARTILLLVAGRASRLPPSPAPCLREAVPFSARTGLLPVLGRGKSLSQGGEVPFSKTTSEHE